jgi:SAM-dependent methyltransferase
MATAARRRAVQAGSFGSVAQTYAAVRPGYPSAAVRWGLPPGAKVALDLGAGTGKVTEVLLAEGLTVYAVDPDERMLEELRRVAPAAHARPGTAEAIPLPAASVDAVLVGHAFHWFGPAALGEMARVLRPGGTVALLWNLRDDSTDWVRAFGALIALGAQDSTGYESPAPFPPGVHFGMPVRRTFAHTQRMDREALLALAGTRGFVLALPEHRRRELLAEVAHLIDTHPQLAGRDGYDLPYVTEVWRAVRRNGAGHA